MADIAVQKKNAGATTPVARRDWDPFRIMRGILRWDFHEIAPVPSFEVSGYSPAFEVKETKDGFVLKADVPGTEGTGHRGERGGQPADHLGPARGREGGLG